MPLFAGLSEHRVDVLTVLDFGLDLVEVFLLQKLILKDQSAFRIKDHHVGSLAHRLHGVNDSNRSVGEPCRRVGNSELFNSVVICVVQLNHVGMCTSRQKQRRAANQNQFIKLCHFLLQPELSAQGIGNAGCE